MSSNEPIGAKKPLFVRIYCAVIPATCLILMLAAVAAVVYANRTAGGDVATAESARRYWLPLAALGVAEAVGLVLLSLVPAICAAMAILCYMLGGAHCRLLCDIVVVVSLPIFVASLMLVVYDARRLFRMGCRCKAMFGLAMYALAAYSPSQRPREADETWIALDRDEGL